MLVDGVHYKTIWMEGPVVRMIDQLALPFRFAIFESPNHETTSRAIEDMVVRGAGAIGAAAGYAVAQAALEAPREGFSVFVERACSRIRSTRPTARNLFYAVNRVRGALEKALGGFGGVENARKAACAEAEALAADDTKACKAIAEAGSRLLSDGSRMLTHCNAGWLGFSDWGTALSPLYWAKREGKRVFCWVDETRPRLQGARLTAWELWGEGIEFRIIVDNAAGWFMRRGEVDLVIVGADRIAANGDVANKIGTYEKALLARESGIPFYVAAPFSTMDFSCPTGDDIPIEERDEGEVLEVGGIEPGGAPARVRVSVSGARARNPAFDVTPAALIKGVITEKGIVPPGGLAALARPSAIP